jgi:hypothetical protein
MSSVSWAPRETDVVTTLALNVLGRGVRIRCADPTAGALLSAAYGSMQGDSGAVDLEYTVSRPAGAKGGFQIERSGVSPIDAPDDGMLLALFDADLAVEIQRLRPDLYVVHAAVLTHGDGAVMLVARSGGGKSTLSWALLHHGLGYLSDELAPIDLATLDILPFPRALMVKRAPPASHPMTPNALKTARGFHVPAAALPSETVTRPARLRAIFFLHYAGETTRPSVRRLTAAEGAARLYANTLNPLAHPGEGLDGAVRITSARPCFELMTADLGSSCELLVATLKGAA